MLVAASTCRRLSALASALGRQVFNPVAPVRRSSLNCTQHNKFCSSSAIHLLRNMYQIEERGNPNSLEYRLFIRKCLEHMPV